MLTAEAKTRHAIMRKLQRADWAMQEEDSDDALSAVLSAVRLTRKLDPYEALPDNLPAVLGRAVATVLDSDLGDGSMAPVLAEAGPLLIREGENFRPCDYGM